MLRKAKNEKTFNYFKLNRLSADRVAELKRGRVWRASTFRERSFDVATAGAVVGGFWALIKNPSFVKGLFLIAAGSGVGVVASGVTALRGGSKYREV